MRNENNKSKRPTNKEPECEHKLLQIDYQFLSSKDVIAMPTKILLS